MVIRSIFCGWLPLATLLIALSADGRPPPVRARPVQPRVKKQKQQEQEQQQQQQQQGSTPADLLKEAESAYEQLEYEKALKTLIKVHAAQGVTDVQRARAYLYMGVCFTALGDPNNAIASFMEVLKRRPDFRMPAGVSPSIRAMFEEALKRVKGSGAASGQSTPTKAVKGDVAIDARTSPQVLVGKPVTVRINLEDPKKLVRRVVVFWRRRRGPDFSRIVTKVRPGRTKLEAMIPAAALGKKPGTLTFYAEAQDAKKQVLDNAGDEEKPFEMMLVTSLKKKGNGGISWWWFAAGGLAVAAGVVATVIAATQDDDESVPQDQASLTVILK